MKWQKYANLVATNRIAATCLGDLVGPPILQRGGTHPDFTLQEWVEQRLEYVAIRPWEGLDMSATDASTEHARGVYSLHYHIGGAERICSRQRWLTDEEFNRETVSQALSGIAEWYERYWALQPDRPLIIDAVARKSSCCPVGEKYAMEAVSIWLAPEDFRP